MVEENGMETYELDQKPDYLTAFLIIVAVVLLVFGWGYKNAILGYVGIMCSVLVILKFFWKKYNK